MAEIALKIGKNKKRSRQSLDRFSVGMEAAGIEPASENPFTSLSTGVDHLRYLPSSARMIALGGRQHFNAWSFQVRKRDSRAPR